MSCPSTVEAMTDLLRDEHAAVYAYGVLGSRLGTAERRVALTAYDAHRAARDDLRARLLRAKAEPPATQAAYGVVVAGPEQARALAVRVEEQLAVRWRDLVALSSAADVRRVAVGRLQDCAVRAALWREAAGLVTTTPFPGA